MRSPPSEQATNDSSCFAFDDRRVCGFKPGAIICDRFVVLTSKTDSGCGLIVCLKLIIAVERFDAVVCASASSSIVSPILFFVFLIFNKNNIYLATIMRIIAQMVIVYFACFSLN